MNEDAMTRHIGREYILRDFFKSGVAVVKINLQRVLRDIWANLFSYWRKIGEHSLN